MSLIFNSESNVTSILYDSVLEDHKPIDKDLFKPVFKYTGGGNEEVHYKVYFNDTEDYIGLCRHDFFSCGARIAGNIEYFYREYGIEYCKKILNYFINDYNKMLSLVNLSKIRYILFSITDRNEELINLFREVSCSQTDFEKNPNSDNRIAIFTLKCV